MHLTIPSERNFEIYHAVVTDQCSRRAAAAMFGVSSSRVQQIVAQVAHFLEQYGGESLLPTAPERMELAALHVCHARLDHFYKMTMHQWSQAKDRPGPQGPSVRLLHSAARLSIDQTKVVGRIAKLQQSMIEAGTLQRIDPNELTLHYEEDEVAEPVSAATTSAGSPPAGGCTVPPATSAAPLLERLTPVSATISDDLACDQLLGAMLRRRENLSPGKTPAHSRRKRRGSAA